MVLVLDACVSNRRCHPEDSAIKNHVYGKIAEVRLLELIKNRKSFISRTRNEDVDPTQENACLTVCNLTMRVHWEAILVINCQVTPCRTHQEVVQRDMDRDEQERAA